MKNTRRFLRSKRALAALDAALGDIRNQPFICWETEMSVEEARRRFGFGAPRDATGVKIGVSVVPPLEVAFDPHPHPRQVALLGYRGKMKLYGGQR